MAHGLTPKQERFCIEFFRCGNASEAYRIAYDAEKMTDATINRKAFEVLDNGKITARLDELKSAVAKKVTVTKERAIEVLSNIMEGADKEADRIAASRQIGKFLGWEAPAKQEINFVSPFEKFLNPDLATKDN
jgi:phage terminase small subunit